MPDYADRYTDRKISDVDKRLRQTYRTAQKELKAKLDDFNRKSAARDKEKQRQLKEGKISEQQYKDWLAGQVFIRKQWENKVKQVSQVMTDHNRQAMNIINTSRFDVFAENYNYNAFQTEKVVATTSFNLYNAEAVARMMMDEPQLLPEWKVDKEKDYRWNSQKVNNIVTQGIIQGESIDRITKRLCEDLSTQNENRMRMFARTAMTGAENAGRQRQMHDSATRFGIVVHKVWESAHDSRTRDWHIELDGQEVPENEMFENRYGEIEYPGDPGADPANVYNCRCTMKSIYPEYEDREAAAQRYEEMEIDGQSYEEWKEGKSYKQSYTEKEKEAIEEYTRSTYSAVNTALRENTVGENKTVEGLVDGIDSAMAKSELKESKTASRGTDFKEIAGLFGHRSDWYEEYDHLMSLIGKDGIAKEYTSSTVGDKPLEQFAEKGVELVLNVHKGVNAIYVPDVANTNAAQKENELLIDRNVVYEVTGIECKHDDEGYVVGKVKIFIDVKKLNKGE